MACVLACTRPGLKLTKLENPTEPSSQTKRPATAARGQLFQPLRNMKKAFLEVSANPPIFGVNP